MIKKLVSLLLTATMLVVHVPNVYAENEGFADLENQSPVIESKTEENIDIEDLQSVSYEEVNQEINEEINEVSSEEATESPEIEFMVSLGTKAQTIKLALLNTESEIYNSGQLEYTLTRDINDKTYTKWKPFKKNKLNYIDNIKATGEMSLYYRTKPTKENKNPDPMFVKNINSSDIQFLAMPSGSIKSTANGFYEITNLTFGNAYKDHEYSFSYDETTALWENCPLIVTSKKVDLTKNYQKYNEGESLFLRKKATANLPRSVAKKFDVIGSSAPPISKLNVTSLGNYKYYFDIDFSEYEDLSSKFQYAIIKYEDTLQDQSKAILKASWQSVKKQQFEITKKFTKSGNYLFALRIAKNSKIQASQPIFANSRVIVRSTVPGNDSIENNTELSVEPLTVDMSELLSEFTKSN